ncbi:MAG: PEP-CTERM system TPR-repeat protein PrsT [Betaproteobacteria bacterium]|nr:PEP-CTERM system TPR-repeat protein PrsT [Betaproteobacteria bacterium]
MAFHRKIWFGAPRLAAWVLFATLAAACSKNDANTSLGESRAAQARGDTKAAVIHAKNALTQTDSGETRFALGNALLEAGDTQGALVHLRQAHAAKHAPDETLPALTRTLLARGEFARLASEFASAEPAGAASYVAVKNDVGEALLATGKLDDALRAFEAALGKASTDDRAQAGLARVAALKGDFAAARAKVTAILAARPASVHALSLKADLFAVEGNAKEAVHTLRELSRAAPGNVPVRVTLANLQMAQGQLEDAQVTIDGLRKDAGKDLRVQHLAGAMALRRGDAARARDAAIVVLNAAPDYAPAQLLAGTAEFQMGAFATAASHLKKVTAKQATNVQAQSLLATSYLRMGQPEKADDTMAQALARNPGNASLHRAAGEVALAANRLKDAARHYERAVALEKDPTASRTRLAQIRLAAGESERAMADLELATTSGKEHQQATLTLVSTHLSRGDYTKAEAAIAVLEKDMPNHPLPSALRASAALAKKDKAAARAAQEKALQAQFDYVPAARILAELDLADNNPKRAFERLEGILARSPAHEGAHLALANLKVTASLPRKEVSVAYENAVKANASSVLIRIAHGRFLSEGGETQAALAAARAAMAAIPSEPRIHDLLGLAQLAANDTAGAIDTYNAMAKLQPDSPVPHLRLAAATYRANRPGAPIDALRKALALQPDLAEAQRGIVTLMLEAGKIEEAMKEAKAVQAARAGDATGFAMEGDVLEKQKRPAEAARAYGEGLKRQSSPELLVKQMDNLAAAGQQAEARTLAARWITQNPDDPVVRYHAATTAMIRKDYKDAIDHYRELIKRHPSHTESLNNLAWVLGEQKDPGALAMAERAHQSAPGNPNVTDTYGWLLAQQGDLKKGIELLTQAAAAEPKSASIRIHLTRALIKSGDKARARRELEEIAVMAGSSPLKADIDALLKSL